MTFSIFVAQALKLKLSNQVSVIASPPVQEPSGVAETQEPKKETWFDSLRKLKGVRESDEMDWGRFQITTPDEFRNCCIGCLFDTGEKVNIEDGHAFCRRCSGNYRSREDGYED